MPTREQTIFEFGRIASGADWTLYGIGFAALLALVAFLYRRDTPQVSRVFRRLLLALRIAVYALVFGIFLDPRSRTEATIERPSRAIVLVDASRSMSIVDQGSSDTERRSRRERVLGVFEEGRFLDELRRRQDVMVWRFGRESRLLEQLPRFAHDGVDSAAKVPFDWSDATNADQDQTRLGEALEEVLRGEPTNPVSGIVLFSDGGANAGPPVDAALDIAAKREIPIHIVALGSEEAPANFRVVDLQAPARVFRGDAFELNVVIQGAGAAAGVVPVELILYEREGAAAPTVIETLAASLPADGSTITVKFTRSLDTAGQWRIGVRLPIDPEELRTDDNTFGATIEVMDRRTKMLLFASGPTREFRFLRTLLYRDDSVETSVLLQSARRAIAQDADHVLSEFPKEREDLFGYDVIVAFDPDWARLTPAQRDLLADWVGKHAGGLVLVAGPVHTPRLARDETLDEVRALYPVVPREALTSDLDRGGEAGPWPIALTNEGRASDLIRLEEDAERSARRWSEFTGFFSAYPVGSVKPGATVLAEFTDPRARLGASAPALFVTQYFGAGRVLYLGSGEFWRLRALGEDLYDRFWVRVVRQIGQGRLLRGTSRGTLALDAERLPLGQPIRVRARLLDDAYRPLLAESVNLSMVDPSGRITEPTLDADVAKPGEFAAIIRAPLAGEYRLQLLVPGTSDVLERRVQVVAPDLEFDDPRMNRALLERLANQTGGVFVPIDQVDAIPPLLEDRSESTVFSTAPTPLWDRAWVMLAIILLLCAERSIRKILLLA